MKLALRGSASCTRHGSARVDARRPHGEGRECPGWVAVPCVASVGPAPSRATRDANREPPWWHRLRACREAVLDGRRLRACRCRRRVGSTWPLPWWSTRPALVSDESPAPAAAAPQAAAVPSGRAALSAGGSAAPYPSRGRRRLPRGNRRYASRRFGQIRVRRVRIFESVVCVYPSQSCACIFLRQAIGVRPSADKFIRIPLLRSDVAVSQSPSASGHPRYSAASGHPAVRGIAVRPSAVFPVICVRRAGRSLPCASVGVWRILSGRARAGVAGAGQIILTSCICRAPATRDNAGQVILTRCLGYIIWGRLSCATSSSTASTGPAATAAPASTAASPAPGTGAAGLPPPPHRPSPHPGPERRRPRLGPGSRPSGLPVLRLPVLRPPRRSAAPGGALRPPATP